MSNTLWQLQATVYNGLEMRCAPGTHEAALALLLRSGAPKASVLDLASGTGAFLARLRDNGFTDLHALELDTHSFHLDGVRPLALDLNNDFAPQIDRRFSLITAIEIIEHLDSPRHLLRQVHQLLNAQGMLLVTTPNVANWAGRIQFLVSGDLRFFEEKLYRKMRHISPITDTQLRLMIREVGFVIIDSVSAGTFHGPLKRLATAPISLLFRLAFGPKAIGDANIYLVQKAEPDLEAPGSSSHYVAAARRRAQP